MIYGFTVVFERKFIVISYMAQVKNDFFRWKEILYNIDIIAKTFNIKTVKADNIILMHNTIHHSNLHYNH